jgi:hypothetical protein
VPGGSPPLPVVATGLSQTSTGVRASLRVTIGVTSPWLHMSVGQAQQLHRPVPCSCLKSKAVLPRLYVSCAAQTSCTPSLRSAPAARTAPAAAIIMDFQSGTILYYTSQGSGVLFPARLPSTRNRAAAPWQLSEQAHFWSTPVSQIATARLEHARQPDRTVHDTYNIDRFFLCVCAGSTSYTTTPVACLSTVGW